MKILLANSYFLERDANESKIMKPYPPLGMLYISSSLKAAGHEVQLFDGTFSTYGDYGARLKDVQPDLVGIYANVITRQAALEMLKEAHAAGYAVIMGGPDPTGDGQAYLDSGALAIVRGEGEHTALELTARLEEKGMKSDLSDIPGLILRGEKGLAFTADRERIKDLDALPMPDRESLDMDRYLKAWRGRHGLASMSLMTSRGCPYRCAWCSKEIFGEVVRQRSPESVIAEVRHLRERYNPEQLWFSDDILTLNRNWTLKFTRLMKEEGLVIPFECLSRVDRVDPEMAAGLKEAGCFRIWYGAESGSNRMVKAMGKDFSVQKVIETVHLTMDAGIQAGLFILIGYPGEKMLDLLKTVGMIRALKADYCGSSVAFPIKGTQFYEDVRHMLDPDYSWSKRNENRITFKGRYPSVFYWCAVRLIHNWATFFSRRTRKDGLHKQCLRAVKFLVAGTGLICVGTLFDLKEKLFPGQNPTPSETVKKGA